MKAVDTNVIVRLLISDRADQEALVRARFRRAESTHEAFRVPIPVTLELIWVLGSVYGFTRHEVLAAFEALTSLPVLQFDRHEAVRWMIREAAARRAGLADLLIAACALDEGCDGVLTFDRKALADGSPFENVE